MSMLWNILGMAFLFVWSAAGGILYAAVAAGLTNEKEPWCKLIYGFLLGITIFPIGLIQGMPLNELLIIWPVCAVIAIIIGPLYGDAIVENLVPGHILTVLFLMALPTCARISERQQMTQLSKAVGSVGVWQSPHSDTTWNWAPGVIKPTEKSEESSE